MLPVADVIKFEQTLASCGKFIQPLVCFPCSICFPLVLVWPVLWWKGGGIIHRGVSMFLSFNAVLWERGPELSFNLLILSAVLWQSKCYLQPHCTGRTFPSQFPQWERKIWNGNLAHCWYFRKWDVSFPTAAIRCTVRPQIWLLFCFKWKFYSGFSFPTSFKRSLCFPNPNDFNTCCPSCYLHCRNGQFE